MALEDRQALAEERTAAGRERLDLLKCSGCIFDVRILPQREFIELS